MKKLPTNRTNDTNIDSDFLVRGVSVVRGSLNQCSLVCGIDEAGRGPLAGPVTAGAVILPSDFPTGILADSKVLSAKKREAAAQVIYEKALAWGIGWASHKEIDKINILQASLLAMSRAFDEMQKRCPQGLHYKVIVDGLYVPALNFPPASAGEQPSIEALVKADTKIPAVMAASILAKTNRDERMLYYDKLYPQYHYAKHKGYPTKEHRALIARWGPSAIQRLTFKVKLP
jgi:ribonuclease HII